MLTIKNYNLCYLSAFLHSSRTETYLTDFTEELVHQVACGDLFSISECRNRSKIEAKFIVHETRSNNELLYVLMSTDIANIEQFDKCGTAKQCLDVLMKLSEDAS